MDYNSLRTFADSWGLFGMALFFVFVVLYAFRPGSKKKADEAKEIPFKDDEND
ncbi:MULTISPECIES: CcoQ/FixQ family Cbb3-type cytochrome c oxidase assembly chaperone [Brucella]|uniref:Cytochrome c oxidase, cbb3-type, CcoQ subunit n=4 Tax=Brucella TaxID=234 RepID=C0G4B5_9HYPH|nr:MULTISPECIES: CcoQ/FixQ family Cbb3-type cytochrome c oxidase assembly chaperone [Brucella]AEK53702.1 cytochrome c oxidase, cbb3-type, CcoQ subunit [Brucella pinnipedialis B2/94]AHA99978.1 CBB3-type cytochrome oxidase component [Brucella ceti TE10759-12]AHB02484.1 CBB3-type cytochrome oxidase component [Brucella ceti TE28753-12]AIJ73417.1 cbb3-type cytochrome oxidase component FixQ family protein [Brucella pinnipedialis]EEH15580.1 cytochrome c oxidase, cbb3-type, CcoQ subunit [Brucella ceti